LFGFIQHKRSPVVADDPEQPVAVEVIPSVRGGYSAIASGNAPFVYFENAGNLLALRSLRDALDAVLLMAEPSPGDSLD
jgi:hypothetical protein